MAETPTYRVSLSLERDKAERAMMVLSEIHWPPAAAVGFTERPDGTCRLDAWFEHPPALDGLEGALAGHGIEARAIASEKLDDVDWVAQSQARLHIVRAGRFRVHGRHDRARVRGCRWAIEIDASRAFGTAHHGTTRGCLQAIDDLAKRERFARVLDIGTGTGVLAIAAARVWHAPVIAGDLDPLATDIAAENIRLNGVRAYVRTVTAAGLTHPQIRARAPYDLVLANILANPLVAMARDIARALRPGGIVVLSGLTRDQAGRVAAAYGAAGFTRLRLYANSEWVTLVLRRGRR